jgi:hypothetical protein
MIDLQVVYLMEQMSVTKLGLAEDDGKVYIQVEGGPGFSKADLVLVDGKEFTEWVALSDHIIHIPMPEDLTSLKEVRVLGSTYTLERGGMLKFDLGAKPRTVGGSERLVQKFVKLLLTDPSRGIFNRGVGGGLDRVINQSSRVVNPEELYPPILQSVSRTKEHILAGQSLTPVPANETLKDAVVLGLTYSSSITGYLLRLRIDTASGTTSVAELGI